MKKIIIFTLLQQLQCDKCKTTAFDPSAAGKLTPSTNFLHALSNLNTHRKAIFDSPQCWMGSFQDFLSNHIGIYEMNNAQAQASNNLLMNLPGESLCAALNGDQRTILALELTKCFFTKSYLKFSPKCYSSMTSKEDIKTCIQSLNPSEFNSYNEFYNQIYHICTQLSQETWNEKLMESTFLLFESSKSFSENLDQIVMDHRIDWDEFNQKYRSEQEFYFNKMNKKLEESSSEMDRISQIFQKVNSVVSQGEENITILWSSLLFLAQLNGIYMVTYIFRSRHARPYMILTLVFGLTFEMTVYLIDRYYDLIPSSLSNFVILSIRKWTLIIETAILLIFLFIKKDTIQSPVTLKEVQVNNDELIQEMNSMFKMYRSELQESQDRLMRLFQDAIDTKNTTYHNVVSYQPSTQRQYHPITPIIHQHHKTDDKIPYEIIKKNNSNHVSLPNEYMALPLPPSQFIPIASEATKEKRGSFTSLDSFESARSRISNQIPDHIQDILKTKSKLISSHTEEKMETGSKGSRKKRRSDELENVDFFDSEKRRRKLFRRCKAENIL